LANRHLSMCEEKQHQCKKNDDTKVKRSCKTNARRLTTPTWEKCGILVQEKAIVATQEEPTTLTWK
jgi:hypothetical protein